MNNFTVPFYLTSNDELVPEEHRHLGYQLVARTTGQKVTNGRLHIEPALDLDQYRALAVIDWVEIAFQTKGVHQALNINRSLGRVHDRNGKSISPRVNGPGREVPFQGSHFLVRLQDPTPALVRQVANHLSDQYEIVSSQRDDFEITGIEISVDFYPYLPGDPTLAALELRRWMLSEVLRKHVIIDPSFLRERLDAPRVVFRTGAPPKLIVDDKRKLNASLMAEIDGTSVSPAEVAALHRHRHYHAPLDGTYYVGRKNGEVHLRLQDKTTDQRNTSLMVLAPEERRSRIEVCLLKEKAGAEGGPASIGLVGLDDVFGFQFERIRKARLHFSGVDSAALDFSIPTIAPPNGDILAAVEVDIFKRSGAYGVDRYQRAQERREHAHWERGLCGRPRAMGRKGYCVAYAQLNEKITTALRVLSRRWKPS